MARGEEPTVDGITVVPNLSKDFLRAWLEVMRPVHNLTPKEMDFTAVLLKKREEIAKKVKDQSMIDTILFGKEMKERIAEEAGISYDYMKGIMRNLKNNGVIQGNRVDPKYLPSWTAGKPFRWLFIFKNEL